ncbi:thioesterase II family protein [Kitasatospora sp. LaBMicrA B282]|uniref:thioesterase II family protein n=1 Tax=Kitasatospora sp. LaBMicrA B282 TaxID=3420949 RepID=UPI003D12F4AD
MRGGVLVREAELWFTELRVPERPRGRVLLFPHAGSGPHALAGLAALLPADLEVLGVTLPGREHRFAEAPDATDLAELLTRVPAALDGLPPLPLVLFGCSVGALLALHTAARLGAANCAHLVLAAQVPGDRPRAALRARTEAELLEVFGAAGDTPAAVLADADLRAGLLARLAADLRLGEAAAADFAALRVDLPITVLGGLADPLVDPATLPEWQHHTTAACRVVTLSGGHFAFGEPRHAPVLRAVLTEATDRLPELVPG